MKEINLESDLNLICVRAKSFPQGIEEAFKTLESKVLPKGVGNAMEFMKKMKTELFTGREC